DVPEDLREPALGDDTDHGRRRGLPGSDPGVRGQVAGRPRQGSGRRPEEARQADRRPTRASKEGRRRASVIPTAEAAPAALSPPGGGGGGPPRPGPPAGRPPAGQEEGSLAPPRARVALPEPVDPRLLDLLRLPAGVQRVPVVQPLRPALAPSLDRLRELSLSLRAGPADRARRQEHALDDRCRRPAERALRVRRGADARPRAHWSRRLPNRLLPTRARAAGGCDACLRLHPQPPDRAVDHP